MSLSPDGSVGVGTTNYIGSDGYTDNEATLFSTDVDSASYFLDGAVDQNGDAVTVNSLATGIGGVHMVNGELAAIIVGTTYGHTEGNFIYTIDPGGNTLQTNVVPDAGFNAISTDGSTVVGVGDNGALAYAIASGATTNLGILPGGSNSVANAVNADGSVVVGSSETSDPTHAFRWTAAGGMVDLGTLPATVAQNSAASGVSADGNVVVGESGFGNSSDSPSHAFRWTSAAGMSDLGTIAGYDNSAASATGDGGAIVVGEAFNGVSASADRRGFWWSADTGMLDLTSLLGDGWTVLNANAISPDGQFIGGQASVPGNSDPEAYIARYVPSGGLPPPPTVLPPPVSPPPTSPPPPSPPPTITGFTSSTAFNAVSADGTVAVGQGIGYDFSGGQSAYSMEAFRVSTTGAGYGGTPLGALDGTHNDSDAFGVSGDGSVIVGSSQYGDRTGMRAFRYTDTTGVVDLGTLGGTTAIARGISTDAGTIVGESATANGNSHAFRWTASTGMTDIGVNAASSSAAYATDLDGGVIAGASGATSDDEHAFRWTALTGIQDIDTLATADGTSSAAMGISGDGNVLVGGYSLTDGRTIPFRWTAAIGMQSLGLPSGTSQAVAKATNYDGSIVVGNDTGAGQSRAFRWSTTQSFQDLTDLAGGGSAFTLDTATGISWDGQFIVGSMTAGSTTEGYILRYIPAGGLPATPTIPPQNLDTGSNSSATAALTGLGAGEGHGISADGSIVVGENYDIFNNSSMHAFRYTPATGVTDLGTIGGADGISAAYAVSGDDTTIVGTSVYPGAGTGPEISPFFTYTHAFAYTAASGMHDLGSLGAAPGTIDGYPPDTYLYDQSYATAVDATGATIVGLSSTTSGYVHATLWNATGISDLGTLGDSGAFSAAFGVSADGSVIVGASDTPDGRQHAFYRNATGMFDLGALGKQTNGSIAFAVNPTGSVVVGGSMTDAGTTHAFRWTGAGGMQDLGALKATDQSIASAVSADGAVVVGTDLDLVRYSQGYPFDSERAYYWTQSGGGQYLGDLLAAAGVDMTGITLYTATGVSADGSFITGTESLQLSQTEQQAYVARYVPIAGVTPALPTGLVAPTYPGDALAPAGQYLAAARVPIAYGGDTFDEFEDYDTNGSYGLSADGTTVVGADDLLQDGGENYHGIGNSSAEPIAFRYRNGVVEHLGLLPGDTGSIALGVSGNGDVVVGQNGQDFDGGTDGSVTEFANVRAVMWKDGQVVDLTASISDLVFSSAQAVSRDGQTAIGNYYQSSYQDHEFEWRNGALTDFTPLSTSAGAAPGAFVQAIDADGGIVVGQSTASTNPYTGNGVTHATLWDEPTHPEDLGTIGGAFGYSDAKAVSGDGQWVVGSSATPSGDSHAFRWSTGTGMEDLGTLGAVPLSNHGAYSEAIDADTSSEARGVSDDGSIVVGRASSPLDVTPVDGHAFRWTEATGMQDLNGLLAASGLNMGGIVLESANAISADGTVILADNYLLRYAPIPTSPPPVSPPPPPASPPPPVSPPPVSPPPVSPPPVSPPPVSPPPVSPPPVSPPPVSPPPVSPPPVSPPPVSPPPVSPPPVSPPPVSPPPVSPPPISPPPIAGITTYASVYGSVEQLGSERVRVMTQEHGLVAQALSPADVAGEGSQIGIFAATGSQSEGATGRFALGSSIMISGALFETSASYDSRLYGSASLHRSTTVGGSLRWLLPTGSFRPFLEGGGWIVPHADLAFTRAYMNGAGVAVGHTDPGGSLSYYYGRAGIVGMMGGFGRLTVSGEIGRERLHTGRFDETLSNKDPFEAHSSAGTDRLDVAKAVASWTHDLTGRISFAVTGGYDHGFDYRSSLLVTVPGIGTLAPSKIKDIDWAEYGASVSYRFAPNATLSLFGDGVKGGKRYVGSETHGGVAVRVNF